MVHDAKGRKENGNLLGGLVGVSLLISSFLPMYLGRMWKSYISNDIWLSESGLT